ncbi:MAG: ABC transporter permease [Gammaproteobacteria bacterium]|nr:ABC transporter permease [Gammaproteobacteria bacterium]
MNWYRVHALVIKEFLALLRNKASRMVLIGPPVIQLIVFSYAATFNLRHVPVMIYNEDAGAASRQLIARFQGSPYFAVERMLTSGRHVADIISDKKALLVLRIGPRFSRDLALHRTARIEVLIDGRNSNTALITLNDVNAVIQSFSSQWAGTHGWRTAPAVLVTRAWFNPNLRSRWFIVPGVVGLLTLVVAMLVTGLSVAREREAGTFDQLLVTPLGPWEILLGKALPGFLIGSLEATLIIVVAVLWFRVPFTGGVLALYLGLFLFLLAAIGVGLAISSASATQQQGLLGVFLFLVPAVILSGFATPIANMPRPVQYLTYLNPLRYFLIILRGVFLEGDGMTILWAQYLPLIAIGFATMTLATWLFRHRLT